MAAGVNTIAVEWVACAADLPEALWAQTFPPPLEGRWWYLALERSGLERQFTFAYAVLSRGGERVGIAPTFLMDLSLDLVAPDELGPLIKALRPYIPALRHQRTLFVGSPCSEEGVVGLLPGVSLTSVAPVLQAALESRAKALRAHMVVWKDVPEPAARALRGPLGQAGLFEIPGFPGTLIDPAPASFDAYLAGLTGPHRHNLKKKLKSSYAAVDLSVEVVRRPDAALQGEIWGLFRQTYQKSTTRFEELTPAFFAQMAALDFVWFIVLREQSSEQAVAFMMCYLEGGVAVNKFLGIDYGVDPKAFLYFRLFEAFVRWATEQGAAVLQSGQTGYRPKLDLGHELVPLATFSKHRNPLLHRVYARIARSVSWSTLDDALKVYLESRGRQAHP